MRSVATARARVAAQRAQMLAGFALNAEDYPIPRRPEVVAAMTEKLWTGLLQALATGKATRPITP